MASKKPDLLFVLFLILASGVFLSTYGGKLITSCEAFVSSPKN